MSSDDLSSFDIVMAACRPVEWTSEFDVAGVTSTPVYPGSIVKNCESCGRAIYVGPKAQALTVAHRLLCFLCAGIITAAGPATLVQIVAALSVTYTDTGVAIWLTSPNTWANDQRPIEMIADGKADEVAKIVGWIGDADPADFVISERDR